MVGMVTKSMFFDTAKVKKAVSSGTRRVLSKFGAYVRTAARSSIRSRKRASEPGQPPSSHTGLLKQFIFFAYDLQRETVVIGPMPLNRKVGNAPEALEHGGASVVVEGLRRRRRKRRVNIRARPYMRPALEKERPKLPAMWRDSVRA